MQGIQKNCNSRRSRIVPDVHFMLKRAKETIAFFSALLYVFVLPVIRKRTRRIIIYYHGVRENEVNRFEKQIKFLANNYYVVKPSEVKKVILSSKGVVVGITFDDAFVSVMENAVPILKKYGLPAGIFVPADNIGKPPRWEMSDNCSDKNETVMSEEQVSELYNSGFEVFSHTLSHPVLIESEDDVLKAEMVESKQILERIIGHEVIGISYPHGACDKRVCAAAKQAGYKLGFTIEPCTVDDSTDDLQIGRFAVSASDSLVKFRLKVYGAYQVTKYLKALKRKIMHPNNNGAYRYGV
jgi:peptidoglycan/xylan/chitin deacetylase (PgdA/CDA1 family)